MGRIDRSTSEFRAFVARHNIGFEAAAAARQRDGGDHNGRETPHKLEAA